MRMSNTAPKTAAELLATPTLGDWLRWAIETSLSRPANQVVDDIDVLFSATREADQPLPKPPSDWAKTALVRLHREHPGQAVGQVADFCCAMFHHLTCGQAVTARKS